MSNQSPDCLRKATRARAKCRADRSETDLARFLYFRHHLSAPFLFSSLQSNTLSHRIPFPPYTDSSIKEIPLSWRDGEECCMWGMRACGAQGGRFGAFYGGGVAVVYRKIPKTCAYRCFIGGYHVSFEISLRSRFVSFDDFSICLQYIQHGKLPSTLKIPHGNAQIHHFPYSRNPFFNPSVGPKKSEAHRL